MSRLFVMVIDDIKQNIKARNKMALVYILIKTATNKATVFKVSCVVIGSDR